MTKIYIISDEKYNALRSISDTERGASGYSMRQEAIEAELERLGENTETAELVCRLEDSPEDWASHYLAEDEGLLSAEGRYLMTREQYAWWEEALAALERGEDPFN